MMARRGRRTEPEPDPIRPLAHLSDVELAALKANVRAEELARAAEAAMADRLRDPAAEEAQALDLARVGLEIFKALELPVAPEPPARWLPDGAGAAERLQFAHTLTAWERQSGGDKARLRSALARAAGHYPGADWRAMADMTKAMRAEADRLEKRATLPGVAQCVAIRLANLASEFREEADRTFALLERRGWTSAQARLAPRDFVIACIEVVRLLAPDTEIHARRTPGPDKEKGFPALGFPSFVDRLLVVLGDRPHLPDDWERATQRAVRFWKAKQKAASRENG